MTDLAALRALHDAVKAGDAFGWYDWLSHEGTLPENLLLTAREAHHGSLDAAHALHKAVLPGWGWAVEADSNACVWHPDTFGVSRDIHIAPTPARALLLAILAALIAEAEAREGKG